MNGAQTVVMLWTRLYRPAPQTYFVSLLCSIDNDLVQEDSEFKGSRQFGMSYCSPETGGVAEIGTVLEVTGHSPFDDGRLIVNTRGEPDSIHQTHCPLGSI